MMTTYQLQNTRGIFPQLIDFYNSENTSVAPLGQRRLAGGLLKKLLELEPALLHLDIVVQVGIERVKLRVYKGNRPMQYIGDRPTKS
jgi:hypothetical protein